MQNLNWFKYGILLVFILTMYLIGCGKPAAPVPTDIDISIPAQSDWTDYGPIFTNGSLGEWDYLLWGGFAGTGVNKDGTYYLYYQGARGYRTIGDETVTWRAIGVATSPDGVNFNKYPGNPVLTWFPTNEAEEGAASGAVILDDNGEFVFYYGANTAVSPSQVHADTRLATSLDGFNFTDLGIILDHMDGSVWGSGDELFPIITLHDASDWFVYYIPNGTSQSRKLGIAWGNNPDNLNNSSAATSAGASIQVWGMGGSAKIGTDTYALFLNDVTKRQTEVRTLSLSTPNQLSAPVETYRFDEVNQATVLLDKDVNTWFMYYRGEKKYGVKLAPAGEPDTSPPTAPHNLAATPVSDRQVDLSWSPALDSDTGIVLYKVFRAGVHLATVKGWSFSDNGLIEQTEYSYTVSAVNYHGVEGPQSNPVTVTTPLDVTPPSVVSVNASGSSNQVSLVFDEPLEEASAENLSNYSIDKGISISGATLNADLKTVVLTTSDQQHFTTYKITVKNVKDRAQVPNIIAPGTTVSYTHSDVSGMVGAWTFDEGVGEIAFDTANYGNDGALIYTDATGPTWTEGNFGYALQFDGVDDQVTIEGTSSLENVTDQSYTFTSWVLADSVPPNSSPNDASYSVLVRDYTGLYYDHDRKFRAAIRLSDGKEVSVSSGVYDPDAWHHLVMVVDDTGKTLHLFVDGLEVSASPVSYSIFLGDHKGTPYYIGTSEPLRELYEYRFSGVIDEVMIYDRALTQSEVKRLFTWLPASWIYLPHIRK